MSDRRSITRITFRAIPLTPIHVGDGESVRLDEYFIDEPEQPPDDDWADEPPEAPSGPAMLCRFDQGRALRAMGSERRATFRKYLDQGNLGAASKLLQQAGRVAVVERIALSEASRHELRKAMDEPLTRSGEVRMFIRSGGRPFIPGSSIKGAFRTALASARLPAGISPFGLTHEQAMRQALGIDPADTATDPLRFLSVSDAMLPEGATRIDRTEIVKRGGVPADAGGSGGIQMHYERLLARSDGVDETPEFEITIAVDSRANESRFVEDDRARFDVRALLFELRTFHLNAFNSELRHFFPGGADQTRKAVTDVLKGAVSRDGRPPYTSEGVAADCILFRLGRFGHFESKSLARVRQGHFPQAKNPADRIRKPDEWGSSRTVTRNGRGPPIPFGWVLAWIAKEETL